MEKVTFVDPQTKESIDFFVRMRLYVPDQNTWLQMRTF